MKQSEATVQRLHKVLLGDKIAHPTRVAAVLKSDIFMLISDYMELSKDALKVNLEITTKGQYKLTIEAVSDRVKDLGTI